MSKIRIATRQSQLALWQARHVRDRLMALDSNQQVELIPMTTRGDQILDQPLAEIGGKGLFLKELERALLDGQADIAVHSLKDVPGELPDGLTLAAYLPRADASDAFLSDRYPSADAMPEGAVVGTSSLRRQSQLLARRPDLSVRDLRGNVDTRIRKLQQGEYDAIILASAGLMRLGMDNLIRQRLTAPEWLPAPAQGIIAIECRAKDQHVLHRIRMLNDPETETVALAERALGQALNASCQLPLGALATVTEEQLEMHAMLALPDGSRLIRQALTGDVSAPAAVGQELADSLRTGGGDEILSSLK